jgi:hypothetical protein
MGKFTRPVVIPADQYPATLDSIEIKTNRYGDEFQPLALGRSAARRHNG